MTKIVQTLRLFFLFLSISLFIPFGLHSQEKSSLGPYTMFEQMIYPKKQQQILSYIADDCARGRATGSIANQVIAQYIRDNFEKYGLRPYFGRYYQQFLYDGKHKGRNVIGMIPSVFGSDKYIIISAHYDHIGALNGYVYNGADDNASGVTALMNLAEMFGSMYKSRQGPDKNIIFVAFDAKENSMLGSRIFVDSLKIPKGNIICNINIDQIGSVLEPVHGKDTNFVIVLGEKTLAREHRGKIDLCNKFYDLDLDIDYTFYGSKNFTDMYYDLSDQHSFETARIPALLFTSGFHKHTYKTTDDVDIISFPVLKKRTLLIFYLTIML